MNKLKKKVKQIKKNLKLIKFQVLKAFNKRAYSAMAACQLPPVNLSLYPNILDWKWNWFIIASKHSSIESNFPQLPSSDN